ncbi:MAG: hypothetical protein AAB250_11855 [Bdellovibrionota bacterium]
MMKSLIVSILVAFGLCATARAEFKVFDDSRVIEKLSTWSRVGTFENVMSCGQSATFEATTPKCELRCDSVFCRRKCDSYQTPDGKNRYDLHIDDCAPGVAHVYGDNGLILDVTKADFAAGAGYFILPFFRGLGQYIQPEGEVHLNWMWPTSAQFIENGQVMTINAYVVEADIVYAGATQMERIRTVWTDQLGGARQLLFVGFEHGDVLLKARGLVGEIMP